MFEASLAVALISAGSCIRKFFAKHILQSEVSNKGSSKFHNAVAFLQPHFCFAIYICAKVASEFLRILQLPMFFSDFWPSKFGNSFKCNCSLNLQCINWKDQAGFQSQQFSTKCATGSLLNRCFFFQASLIWPRFWDNECSIHLCWPLL